MPFPVSGNRWLARTLLLCLVPVVRSDQGTPGQTGPGALKNLSLEQLSQIEVTSPVASVDPL
jgi:hypothetical protein